MCPVELGLTATQMFAISAGMSALTTITGLVGQAAQASAQEKRNQQIAEEAKRAREVEALQLSLRARQERDAANQAIDQNTKRARAAKSTAITAAGEAGVAGLSVDALLSNYSQQEVAYNTAVRKNLDFTYEALEAEGQGVDSRYRSRLNQRTPVQAPNFLGAAARVAGGVFDAYTSYSTKDEKGRFVLG